MKSFKNSVLLVIVISCLFQGCEKVIDIDLNSSSPKVIIEGNLTDQQGPCVVLLSRSVNFDEQNIFPKISGARVELSDNIGHAELLTEEEPGKYVTSSFPRGIPGNVYRLSVTIEGTVYTSVSTMPFPVAIEKLSNKFLSVANRTVKLVEASFPDPGGIPNYYRFVEAVNEKEIPMVFVTDDRLRDGKIIDYTLRTQENDNLDIELKSGDSVSVVLECIDKGVYDYFRTLASISSRGPDEAASPANPISNISGGALGYFCAKSISHMSIVIP